MADESLALSLRAVEGLQLEAGLRSLRGNLPKLAELLQRFAGDHAADVQEARAELARGDVESAQRRMHSLKGVAGMLGLPLVQAGALTAEFSLKNAQSAGEVESALLSLDAILVPACDALLHVPMPTKQVTAMTELSALRAPLVHLRDLVRADALDAIHAWEALMPSLRHWMPDEAAALGRTLDEFSFSDAEQKLDAILLSEHLQAEPGNV
jgi:two-component system sensor histidine kinase/response regulator